MAAAAHGTGPDAPSTGDRTPPTEVAAPGPRALTESTLKCSGYQCIWPRTKSASTMDYRHELSFGHGLPQLQTRSPKSIGTDASIPSAAGVASHARRLVVFRWSIVNGVSPGDAGL